MDAVIYVGLVVMLGVVVACGMAWVIGKANAQAEAAEAGQQQADGDEWEKLSEEEKEYLKRFFK